MGEPASNEAARRQEIRTQPGAAAGPIVIAGLGSVGRRHLRNLAALGWSEIVLYRTGRGVLEDGGAHPTEADLTRALARGPRAVIISNPTSLHLETALAAARAGAHLLIEKPVSDSLEGVEELRAEVQRTRRIALVGYQFRYHPTLRVVRRWLERGAVGNIVSAHAHWGEYLPDWHPGEDYRRGYSARRELGGGALLTLSHPFDYIAWLLGPVRRVGAWKGRRSGLELDVDDVAAVMLELERGAVACVYLDYAQRPPSHRLEIVGTEGTIRWDGGTGVARLYDARTRRRRTRAVPQNFERNALFLEEMRHFLACVRGEEEPTCTLDDGVHALRIACAAHRAAEEGKVVDV